MTARGRRPRKKAAARTTGGASGRKAASRKGSGKKSARKKAARKRAASKKATRKKPASKKATRKKAARKKASKRATAKSKRKKTSRKKDARYAGSRRALPRASEEAVAAQARRVYSFGAGKAQGHADMKETLGGKGANLAEMTRLGIAVPPGFTIATPVCGEYERQGNRIPQDVRHEILEAIGGVERIMGSRFGDAADPLLFSVRSGARASMPGMMDTVLNLGLNDETVAGLAAGADERFALDSYRRFIQMYGDVVLGVPRDRFEMRLDDLKDAKGVHLDTDLEAPDLQRLVADFLEIVEEHTGTPFPQDPQQQLWGSVGAILRSWGNARAQVYRRLHAIPDSWGTAVNVQAMVFGNMGEDCATGVAFTRDPSSGEKNFYGEYLTNAQGEDVVAGVRTPQPINEASRTADTGGLPTLEQEMPRAYRELVEIYQRLESHYRDMQDIEFTIQQGKLWMLQTRAGKRTSMAAVKIAVDMANEGLIRRDEAILRVDANSVDQLLHPTLDPEAERRVVARGLPASPGAAVGRVVFSADVAEERAKAGEKVVLVRIETSPEDIAGMNVAEGILTARGGMTSHAAVVARGMGKSCVSGCSALEIDYANAHMRIAGEVVSQGDYITVDGATGEVMLGRIPTVIPELGGAFTELMDWADEARELKVRTNADSPQDAQLALEFGAEGIGLCRTEHMFFEPDRVLVVREMILASDAEERKGPLDRLLPMQRQDFKEIFRVMQGLPVTVRLLDPPLHEFLPHDDEAICEVAESMGTEVGKLRAAVASLHEFNPMLGHRGCRLAVSYPEIYEMQVRAITEAACLVAAEGTPVRPEIMIPLVSHRGELELLRMQAEKVIEEVVRCYPGHAIRPRIGTMIEVPRAALIADVIARHADFFSFGTNDLTQMAYALSRDDAGKFLPDYMERGILEDDPFVSIDVEGIGELVEMGARKGRSTDPELSLGVCGEHAGDPKSVKFFARAGLDYVSCSPYRVPIARLAAAQAAIEGASKRPTGEPS